jgi:hypothetical protein
MLYLIVGHTLGKSKYPDLIEIIRIFLPVNSLAKNDKLFKIFKFKLFLNK